ncbi:pyridoxal phosphate-dependent transferase [Jimgerdemannia flammicorona]|uniref:Molybdenum cofactor sulfurase n=1 Tax=Jimgerdemannia flammicorona TaxID=994334 RepID=A0A433CX45_9FUNG|nr:pyridoxal phosphate-dependent transferase [Jimgerdemannia flammicorona]
MPPSSEPTRQSLTKDIYTTTDEYDTLRDRFLRENESTYGYGGRIDRIREEEFPTLKGQVYLDHAGTTIPCSSHHRALYDDLSTHLYGNPHSQSPSSSLTQQRVTAVRTRVLRMLGVDPGSGAYDVIFTANASAAIRIVGECFPWQAGSQYLCLREAHTSLVGVRECALAVEGATVRMVTEEEVEVMFPRMDNAMSHENPRHETAIGADKDRIGSVHERDPKDARTGPVLHRNADNDAHMGWEPEHGTGPKSLFAYPAQSNFSGTRFPLSWTNRCKRRHPGTHMVLLDAASFCTSSPLTLSNTASHPTACTPDFVCMSFYKLFGMPTGLGVLVVRPEAARILRRNYFGGGTIDALAVDSPWHISRSLPHERFEDGTINFLDILSLDHAMDAWERVFGSPAPSISLFSTRDADTFRAISTHVGSLTGLLVEGMRGLVHGNGRPLCKMHLEIKDGEKGEDGRSRQGSIVNFNLRREDGGWIGSGEVARLAALEGIHLRTGRFCNAGSFQRWLNFTAEDMKANFAFGKSCGDEIDIINGRPVGAVRISLGAMSTVDDVLHWLRFLREYFVEGTDERVTAEPAEERKVVNHQEGNGIVVSDLVIYPIKSCHGYSIPHGKRWNVTPRGLLYDREWMLVHGESGVALSQRKFPRMTLIRPRVDLEAGYMITEAPGLKPLRIPLDSAIGEKVVDGPLCPSKVCGDSIPIVRYMDPEIATWFTMAMGGVACTLARHPADSTSSRFVKPHLLAERERQAGSDDGFDRLSPLSLSNESPFLLISERSVEDVREKMRERARRGGEEISEEAGRTAGFRGNVVVRGLDRAYQEDGWRRIKIGGQMFEDTQPCSAYFPGSYRASPYIPFLLHTPPDMANCPPPKAPRTLPEVSHGVHRPGYWCAV